MPLPRIIRNNNIVYNQILKITFVQELNDVYSFLDNKLKTTDSFCCSKYVIQQKIEELNTKHRNSLRIYKVDNFIDLLCCYFTSQPYGEFYAALDYTIYNSDKIKVEYLNTCDDEYADLFKLKEHLTDIESKLLTRKLFNYVENEASKHNIKKITIDTHNNGRIYQKYLKINGFIKTEEKCEDNPFWNICVKTLEN